MKKIAVVIVNYNGQRFLSRLFDSIYRQTFSDFEIVFVDNDSKDDSVKFVRENFPLAKIVLSENKGYGHACNLGAKNAQSEYVLFLNEDMYLPEDFLAKIVAFWENLEKKEKNIGAINCKLIDFDSDPHDFPKTLGAYMDPFGFPVKNKDPRDIFIISGCPFCMERRLFLDIKGFNENIFLYGEDIDLSWRLKIFGYNNFVIHGTHIFHYGGGVTGNFGPAKIAVNLCSSFVPIFSNYKWYTLTIILPLYAVYIFLIWIVLFPIKKFDYRYNLEICKKYGDFLKKIGKIYAFRRFIQKKRKKNDWYIISRYWIFMPAFIANRSYQKLSKKYKIAN